MSKRCAIKERGNENQALRFFRGPMKFSQLEEALRSELSGSMIAHLEQRRIDLKAHYLSKLFPLLDISKGVLDAFESRKTPVPKDLRREFV